MGSMTRCDAGVIAAVADLLDELRRLYLVGSKVTVARSVAMLTSAS